MVAKLLRARAIRGRSARPVRGAYHLVAQQPRTHDTRHAAAKVSTAPGGVISLPPPTPIGADGDDGNGGAPQLLPGFVWLAVVANPQPSYSQHHGAQLPTPWLGSPATPNTGCGWLAFCDGRHIPTTTHEAFGGQHLSKTASY
jgi:hypothetical protein